MDDNNINDIEKETSESLEMPMMKEDTIINSKDKKITKDVIIKSIIIIVVILLALAVVFFSIYKYTDLFRKKRRLYEVDSTTTSVECTSTSSGETTTTTSTTTKLIPLEDGVKEFDLSDDSLAEESLYATYAYLKDNKLYVVPTSSYKGDLLNKESKEFRGQKAYLLSGNVKDLYILHISNGTYCDCVYIDLYGQAWRFQHIIDSNYKEPLVSKRISYENTKIVEVVPTLHDSWSYYLLTDKNQMINPYINYSDYIFYDFKNKRSITLTPNGDEYELVLDNITDINSEGYYTVSFSVKINGNITSYKLSREFYDDLDEKDFLTKECVLSFSIKNFK